MRISPRAALAAALSLAGVAALIAPAPASAQQDETVRKTNATASAPTQALVVRPATIGTLDLDQVLKGYDKFKANFEKIQAEAMVEQEKLVKLGTEGKQLVEELSKFQPGSPDYKERTNRIAQIKATLDAKKEQLQQDFELRSSEAFAAIFKDVQEMTAKVAKKHGLAYVVKVSKEQISATDRNSMMAVMSQPLIYSDPSMDVTSEVVMYLNHFYKASGGTAPKSTTAPAVSTTAPGAAAPKIK